MKWGSITSCVAIVVLLEAITGCLCQCGETELRQGCRIQEGRCLCGIGCRSDYRYINRRECDEAMTGNRDDICSEGQCQNSGQCNQIISEPGYECKCSGTGYHGSRCEYRCPRPSTDGSTTEGYPFECIVI